ncbi:MAG: Spx/MgsR family RNA polymerase-binding regulatory protein [Thiomicrospira sp.]|jgi:Spx/MgsR family transcriptional regulator|nr:Spx/MgsR family RNA polymerase-binding regulatory protein [Thiomicrospira sp.]
MILFGISNCDTVKKARAYLDQAQRPYHFHDFRKDGLSAEHIQAWLLTVPYVDLINKRSTTWKQLDENQRQAIEQQDLVLLCQHPTLIKRPVLQTTDRTLAGFKPADYDKLR